MISFVINSTTSAQVVTFGETLIDFVPNEADVSLAESPGFIKAVGGAPTNVACVVTKLGGSSACVGKPSCLFEILSYG
ncbi:hypothetical protein IFM89_006313 [Coptis chinensis]|uniref:Carbohydrate kinase PfkB domain-containing protein n=1 Tax=Coptis chinensis TaxID=261450 RepID=A0A835IBB4_9MAGN|nr:hypothetical protein IFM89_006313 [Coptis chinensis]